MIDFGVCWDDDEFPFKNFLNPNGNQKKSPFDEGVQEGVRTCRFFYRTPISDHMVALKAGDIGKYLARFCEEMALDMKESDDLPEDTEGLYLHTRGSVLKGNILFGKKINVLLLGHEIRHAWQHLRLPPALQNPDSAQGQIFLDRFIEADARAIEFGVALQTIHAMRTSHRYSYNLIACFDRYQKEICESSMERLEEICASPAEIKMAMRRAFDHWIAIGPTQKEYDENTQKTLDMARTGHHLRKVFNFFSGGRGVLPVYTRDHLDPAYPQKLAEAIGFLGDDMGGNYLTQTTGPDFNSAFYTRICHYRLERAAAQISRRV